jgi:glycerol transport system ATP-binding protein
VGGPTVALPLPAQAGRELTLGIRASALRVRGRPGDLLLSGTVDLAEISGSDTFVHAHTPIGDLVAQLTGVHNFNLGAPIELSVSPAQVYVFDAAGALLLAPERIGGVN